MNKSMKKQPLLRLKFEGKAIRDNTILFDDLSIFVSNISLAIDRLVQKLLQEDTSIKKGRPSKSTQTLSALEIVSMKKGSVNLALDLRRNGDQFPGWDVGEQATDLLVFGINSVQKDAPLPKEYDYGVLMALREAGKITERGIDQVTVNSNSTFGRKKTLYTRPLRERIIARISRFEQSYTVVEGRLLSAEVKEDRLRCRIEPSVGEPVSCTFDEQIYEQVIQSMRHFVQAKGEAVYDASNNRITVLHIKDLESIEQPSTGQPAQKAPISSFWRAKTFDELVEEQGVYTVEDLSKITGGWPEGEDVDSFLKAIRTSRVN